MHSRSVVVGWVAYRVVVPYGGAFEAFPDRGDMQQNETPPDSALLFRMIHGDDLALRGLFRRHERRLYAAALGMTKTSWDAEEVVGTAFLELWRRRDSVRIVDDSALPWLLTVVAYAAKNQLRGRRRHQRLLKRVPRPEPIPDHADEVARVVDSEGFSQQVRAALRDAGPQDASVILLCIVQELSTRDAAIALGIPEGTVKSRLSRAKARLRDRLSEHTSLTEEVAR